MIDLTEFAAYMTEQGVDGPTRKSLLWLAQRLNDQDRERNTRIERLEKSVRNITFRLSRSAYFV